MRISDWSSDVCSSDLAAAGGCAVGPDFVRPGADPAQMPLQPKEGQPRQALSADPVPREWWRLLNDPLLDALVARAWDGNLDLQAAAARVEQSRARAGVRSEEHTSELQSLMRISYAVFCLKKKKT